MTNMNAPAHATVAAPPAGGGVHPPLPQGGGYGAAPVADDDDIVIDGRTDKERFAAQQMERRHNRTFEFQRYFEEGWTLYKDNCGVLTGGMCLFLVVVLVVVGSAFACLAFAGDLPIIETINVTLGEYGQNYCPVGTQGVDETWCSIIGDQRGYDGDYFYDTVPTDPGGCFITTDDIIPTIRFNEWSGQGEEATQLVCVSDAVDLDEIPIEPDPPLFITSIIVGVVLVLLLYPAHASYMIVILEGMRNNGVMQGNFLVGFTCPYWCKVLALSVIVQALIQLGLFLWILPGIWAGFAFIFALPLQREKPFLGISGSLAWSVRVTHYNFFPMLGFLIILGMVNLIAAVLGGIGLLLTVPISATTFMSCYKHLVGVNGVAEEDERALNAQAPQGAIPHASPVPGAQSTMAINDV